jgi:hypothetical protein
VVVPVLVAGAAAVVLGGGRDGGGGAGWWQGRRRGWPELGFYLFIFLFSKKPSPRANGPLGACPPRGAPHALGEELFAGRAAP